MKDSNRFPRILEYRNTWSHKGTVLIVDYPLTLNDGISTSFINQKHRDIVEFQLFLEHCQSVRTLQIY